MEKPLSLRAKGLTTILPTINKTEFNEEDIAPFFTDTNLYIHNTLKELATAGVLDHNTNDNTFSLKDKSYLVKDVPRETLSQRVESMVGKDRAASIMVWFFDKVGVDYSNNISLRRALDINYPIARVVQLWGTDEIYTAYEAVSRIVQNRFLELRDIHEYLSAKSAGTSYSPRDI